MSALDLDALERLATERVAAESADGPAEVAFKAAQEVARAAGIFGVWGRRETPAEEAASAAFRAVRDQWHAAMERNRMARIAWNRAAPRDAAVLVLALITRLRAAEARAAWQPIASVPIGETVMLWTPVRRVHVGHVTTLAWCEYTHWQPLPAAPEAP